MSHAWWIRCVDCDEHLDYVDANGASGLATMKRLISIATDLADIKEEIAAFPEPIDLNLEVHYITHPNALAWFVKHKGHTLRPRDEYGHDG